jgi:methionine--tRNA ligase beta chain
MEDIYEGNLPPFIRLFHELNISPASPFEFEADDFEPDEEVNADVFYELDYTEIRPCPTVSIPMYVCAYDIETYSDSGNFPVASNPTDEVIQIGPLVLAKKPKYGNPDDFPFKKGGSVKKGKKVKQQVSLDTINKSSSITKQDFSKVEMRVGTVISAEYVEGSDKLLRLIVSLGELGERQIFSGIREWVKPEEIVNYKVIIVCNLAPRKMRFGTSEGMMISSDTLDGKVSPILLPEYLKEGSILS